MGVHSVCIDSSMHQSYISSNLFLGTPVEQCPHSSFASRHATEKEASYQIKHRISERQRTVGAWLWNKLPKNRTDHFHSMINQSNTENYLSFCPQITFLLTHWKTQSLLPLEKRENQNIHEWEQLERNVLLGIAGKSSVIPMLIIFSVVPSNTMRSKGHK